MENIFEEFYQLRSARGEGMGLGLAIVRRITDLLGHRIAISSVVGEGSCFQIEIPIGQWRIARTGPTSPG
jgi:signal transduction histidine kinase